MYVYFGTFLKSQRIRLKQTRQQIFVDVEMYLRAYLKNLEKAAAGALNRRNFACHLCV